MNGANSFAIVYSAYLDACSTLPDDVAFAKRTPYTCLHTHARAYTCTRAHTPHFCHAHIVQIAHTDCFGVYCEVKATRVS